MTPGLLCRLLELPRVAGMKVSTHDDAMFGPLAEVVRGTSFALIAGDETYYLSALQQGAVGVIGEGCSVYPEILEAIRQRYQAGDISGAQQAQEDVVRALQIKEGLDGGVFWKQFIAEQHRCHAKPRSRKGKCQERCLNHGLNG
jgi:dihydrodipicolinate synthase/N-acetylneuraminate lyase